MLDQGYAHIVASALHHAHQTGGQVQRLQRGLHQTVHVQRSLWVTGVRLDDHGTACGQGRSGVTAQHRKRKREIAGREHGDWAQGHAHAQHRGVTGRRATGNSGVISEGKGCAVLRQRRKAA